VHIIGAIQLVGAACNAVELTDVKVAGKLVLVLVNVGDRNNTSSVVNLVEC
jgi:hypothetical protein